MPLPPVEKTDGAEGVLQFATVHLLASLTGHIRGRWMKASLAHDMNTAREVVCTTGIALSSPMRIGNACCRSDVTLRHAIAMPPPTMLLHAHDVYMGWRVPRGAQHMAPHDDI